MKDRVDMTVRRKLLAIDKGVREPTGVGTNNRLRRKGLIKEKGFEFRMKLICEEIASAE